MNGGALNPIGTNKPIKTLPETFASKETSAYLRMIELLLKYNNSKCKKQLLFIKEWIGKNRINDNEWDLGKNAKDNILFPLSDSWKNSEDRIKDCTYVIKKIIECRGFPKTSVLGKATLKFAVL
jgi:hypothetical protein